MQVSGVSIAYTAINRLSAAPQEAVTESGSGFWLEPVVPVDTTGAVVPCHDAAEMRIAMAANRSVTLFVTVTLVSPPVAIK